MEVHCGPKRKRRKCSNESIDNSHDENPEFHIFPIQPPSNKTQSASPHHPTVTHLSSYDDQQHSESAPAHLGHSQLHSNHISNIPKNQNNNSNNIEINTFSLIPKKTPQQIAQNEKQKTSVDDQQENNQNLSNFSQNHNEFCYLCLYKSIYVSLILINITHRQMGDHLDQNPYLKTEKPPLEKAESTEQTAPSFEEDAKHKASFKMSRIIRLLLDSKRVGGLIGKGGTAISKIRADSHAKILIAKSIPHSLFRICSIEGEISEIINAIHLIIDKMADESARLPPYHITLLAEEKNVGALIGKGGTAITQIRHDTGANIYISSHLMRNSSEKTVDIGGERESVHDAITKVVTRLCDNPCFVRTRMLYDPSLDFEQAIAPKVEVIPAAPIQLQPQTIAAAPPYHPYYVNNGRLINYGLQRFGSVQPQIIPTPNRLLTPMITQSATYHNPGSMCLSYMFLFLFLFMLLLCFRFPNSAPFQSKFLQLQFPYSKHPKYAISAAPVA